MHEKSSFIRVANASKSWISKDAQRVCVLDNFNYEFGVKRHYAIVGPNGCGKTTLLDAISDLVELDSGSIDIREPYDTRTSYVFQNFRESLMPWLDVKDNILWPLRFNRKVKADRDHIQRVLDYVSRRVALERKVASLSGGQAQLVSIARAWAYKPSILLADEPFSALDMISRKRLSDAMMRICQDEDILSITISHSADDAVFLANSILIVSGPPLKIVEEIIIDEPLPRSKEFVASSAFASSVGKVISAVGSIR